MKQVKEGSTAYLDVTFKDKDGAPAAPASFTWRLDCITTGAEVVADTVISAPQATHTITIPVSANVMQVASNRKEQKRVTVRATYGADDGINDDYVYEVVNLSQVT